MKKVCYIHGAFSAFKPDSEKVKGLEKDFKVVGTSYSMENSFEENLKKLSDFCVEESVDFVVGTSLGGLYAAEINNVLDLPAVMINPCVEPQMSLSTIIGTQQNFATGKAEELTKKNVLTYPSMAAISRDCLIFVGMKDDLINSEKTIKLYGEVAKVFSDKDADHYWEFFMENEKIINHLKKF